MKLKFDKPTGAQPVSIKLPNKNTSSLQKKEIKFQDLDSSKIENETPTVNKISHLTELLINQAEQHLS